MSSTPGLEGKHVVFLSWRDTANPEGGGAERYLEKVASGLVARGCRVTIFSAAHEQGPARELRDGIQFVRAGSKLSVYGHGFARLLTRRFGRADLVVDVQNGLPFFSRLATRAPVLVLVHHVHREQWPVVYPGVTGRVGWWIEHALAPRLYRRDAYVAVSDATRDELATLGVDPRRITVVHNGTDPWLGDSPKSITPTISVVGRLVPHKRVEHAVNAVVALRVKFPDLVLHIVGDGWWRDNLVDYVREQGAEDSVRFDGHVSETRKHELDAASWVLALPSLKEGWGLVVGEAGMHGTPTVAYREAGGTRESVADGTSGLLVDTQSEFTEALGQLLRDQELRDRLGRGAREMSRQFSWDRTQESFATLVATLLPRT